MLDHFKTWFRGLGRKAPEAEGPDGSPVAEAPLALPLESEGGNGTAHVPKPAHPATPGTRTAGETPQLPPASLSGLPATAVGTNGAVAIPWERLVEALPEETRRRLPVGAAPQAVSFPLSVLKLALKRGKAVFSWRLICQWVTPPVLGLAEALPGETLIELPVPLLAPRFLASGAHSRQQREISLPADIPDLFATSKAESQCQPQKIERAISHPAAAGLPSSSDVPQAQPGLAPVASPVSPAAPPPAPPTDPGPPPVTQPVPPSVPPAAPLAEASANPVVSVPWAVLLSKWPPEIRDVLAARNGVHSVEFPLSVLEASLKRGKVVLRWRDLAQWLTPPCSTMSGCLTPETTLEVPLSVVAPLFLAQARTKAEQRELTVPEQVPDLFASAVTEQPQPVSPTAPADAETPKQPGSQPPPPPLEPPASASRQITPPLTTPEETPAESSVESPEPLPEKPILSRSRPLADEPFSTPLAMLVALAAPAGSPLRNQVAVPWAELWPHWPEQIRTALSPAPSVERVEIPLAAAEAALRSGKPLFTWGELRQWLFPSAPSFAGSLAEETVLEVPLAPLARGYLGLRSLTGCPERGGSEYQGLAEAEPIAPQGPNGSAVPTASPAWDTAGLVPIDLAPIEDPNQMVMQASRLPGVRGAVLVSADGLLLAGCLPPGVEGEAVAAFLPRLFTQTFAFAWPFNVKQTDSVVYGFAETTVAALKLGEFYLAALAHPARPAPLELLRRLARRSRFHPRPSSPTPHPTPP